jgi:hypothetical protein
MQRVYTISQPPGADARARARAGTARCQWFLDRDAVAVELRAQPVFQRVDIVASDLVVCKECEHRGISEVEEGNYCQAA